MHFLTRSTKILSTSWSSCRATVKSFSNLSHSLSKMTWNFFSAFSNLHRICYTDYSSYRQSAHGSTADNPESWEQRTSWYWRWARLWRRWGRTRLKWKKPAPFYLISGETHPRSARNRKAPESSSNYVGFFIESPLSAAFPSRSPPTLIRATNAHIALSIPPSSPIPLLPPTAHYCSHANS